MSIALRLMLSLSVLMALFWGTTAALTRNVFVSEIDEIVTDNMAATARRLMPLVLESLAEHGGSEAGEDGAVHELHDFNEGYENDAQGFLAFAVYDAGGRLVMVTGDVDDLRPPVAPKPGYVQYQGTLAFTAVDRATGTSVTVLEPGKHRAEAIDEATRALLWPLAWLVPLMALAIWLLTRFSLAPVSGLSQQIAERGGGNLAPLDGKDQPRELRPIVSAVDRLMERLRAAMDAERVFATNSAHELRTPIAGALAQVQRLKAELGSAKGAERVIEIEAQLKRLVEFAEKLLQLSRAESGLGTLSERINMTPILAAVVGEFTSRLAEPVVVEVDNQLGQELMVAMDADAFAICLRNLLENAALHGEKGRPIRVVVGQDWTVRVVNEGAVVPPEVLSRLTTRYVRGESRSGGSGLGLAIVATILRQSEGGLELASPVPGQVSGFEARMVLP
ncbi:MAG: HAMP domain-containing sensor histidine kinase [bacterium]